MSFYRSTAIPMGDETILFNNCNTENLYNLTLTPESIGTIAGRKRIPAGTFIAQTGRNSWKPLSRAKLLEGYTSAGAGTKSLTVDNPAVFSVGDVISSLGDYSGTPTATDQIGTVTAVSAVAQPQITTATPSTVAIGNIFTVVVEGVTVSFTATAATVANVTAGLLVAYNTAKAGNTAIIDITAADTGTALTFTHKETGIPFTVTATAAVGTGGGTPAIAVAITQPVGQITITATANAFTLAPGARVGVAGQIPVGVLAHSVDLTDLDGNHNSVEIAPYNMAMVYRDALPYLDAQIVAKLPKISFIPPFGV